MNAWFPRPRAALAIVAATILLSTGAVRADAAAEAKRLSQRAAASFKDGKYRDAAEGWEKAQALVLDRGGRGRGARRRGGRRGAHGARPARVPRGGAGSREQRPGAVLMRALLLCAGALVIGCGGCGGGDLGYAIRLEIVIDG